MRKVMMFVMMGTVLLVGAMPAAAQATPQTAGPGNWSYAAIGLGLAVALAAFGQSKVASAACEGMARNPAARPGIQLALILGLAFIESLVLFIWVMIFLRAL
ncbi:MAG: ATP synthase F0 subunit C [Candidatus Koribacter versatilis]|uniref:ATP synthase F(0) sector subunit c n=1 Tax=Candidatus Korobacter versatilis TaxID=658062 RepID=A0A932A7U1_9BACT|nr:ATP synthase F0 subunit C [Candidatus Koribacter versatilis]